jgi:UDP-hydrolysing UDP-N-acetyl-D-glucosamine 2-epimerase
MVALGIECTLVLGGSLFLYKYGAAGNNICDDFPNLPTYIMDTIIEGDSNAKMADSVGVLTSKLTTIFQKEKPDLCITIADRFETLGTAIAASYMNVELVHIQGGEVTGSIDDKVRDAVTMLADWHFPATEEAGHRLSDMLGGPGVNINNYGCPSMDLLARYEPTGDAGELRGLLIELHKHGTGFLLTSERPYILVMYHPDTTDPVRSKSDLVTLIGVLKDINCQKVVFWPNIDSQSDELSKLWRTSGLDDVRYIRHLDHKWFARLLWFSAGVVGNSSAGIREASFYGVPSVDIGHRQCGREYGPNTFNGDDDVCKAIHAMLSREKNPCTLYGEGDAGNKIANKISSILEDS